MRYNVFAIICYCRMGSESSTWQTNSWISYWVWNSSINPYKVLLEIIKKLFELLCLQTEWHICTHAKAMKNMTSLADIRILNLKWHHLLFSNPECCPKANSEPWLCLVSQKVVTLYFVTSYILPLVIQNYFSWY